MAKNNNKVKWIKLGFTALLITAAVIASFIRAQADIKAVDTKANSIKEHVGLLKVEGCKPANKAKNDMAVFKVAVQKDISAIQKDIGNIQTIQSEGFKEILKRLKK